MEQNKTISIDEFVNNNKIKILESLNDCNNDEEKIQLLTNIELEMSKIVEGYNQISSFINLMKKDIYEKNPKAKENSIYYQILKQGINVKLDEKTGKMTPDFEKSDFFTKNDFKPLIEVMYKAIALALIDEISEYIEIKKDSYKLDIELLEKNGWEGF